LLQGVGIGMLGYVCWFFLFWFSTSNQLLFGLSSHREVQHCLKPLRHHLFYIMFYPHFLLSILYSTESLLLSYVARQIHGAIWASNESFQKSSPVRERLSSHQNNERRVYNLNDPIASKQHHTLSSLCNVPQHAYA
jgi:hypothetical protein